MNLYKSKLAKGLVLPKNKPPNLKKLGLNIDLNNVLKKEEVVLQFTQKDLCLHNMYVECEGEIIGPFQFGFEGACKIARKLLRMGKSVTVFNITCYGEKEILVRNIKTNKLFKSQPVGFRKYQAMRRAERERKEKEAMAQRE